MILSVKMIFKSIKLLIILSIFVFGWKAHAQLRAGTSEPVVTLSCDRATLKDSENEVTTCTVIADVAPSTDLHVVLMSAKVYPPGATVVPRYTSTCDSGVTLLAGTNTASCTVTAIANTTPNDGNDEAYVDIFKTPGYSLGTPSRQTIIIENDDGDVLPKVTLACDKTTLTDSDNQVATCTVTADAAPSQDLSVLLMGGLHPPHMVAGEKRIDHTTTCTGWVTIIAGSTTTSCTVTAVPNTIPLDTEDTVNVVIFSSTQIVGSTAYQLGNPSQQTITIKDDDLPTVSLSTSSTSLSVGSGATATITAKLNDAVHRVKGFTVPLTVSGLSGSSSQSTCSAGITIDVDSDTGTCTVTALDTGTTTSTVKVASNCSSTSTCISGAPTEVVVNVQQSVTPSVTLACDKAVVQGNTVASATCTVIASGRKSMTARNLAADLAVDVSFTAPSSQLYDPAASTCNTSRIVIPANATKATCTITTTANILTTSGIATLTLKSSADYTIGVQNVGKVVVLGGRASGGVSPGTDGVGSSAIPTLSEVGMVALIMLMAIATLITRRRQFH